MVKKNNKKMSDYDKITCKIDGLSCYVSFWAFLVLTVISYLSQLPKLATVISCAFMISFAVGAMYLDYVVMKDDE